jgi:cytoskeletal protein CcmA (bactofilin family)
VIAQGTRVEGDVSGDDSLEVAGRLEGSSRVKGLCHIGPQGSVKGDITAATIVIEGRLEGSTLVADKVELGARAQVRADIHARIVAVAEGAVLDGQVHMGEGEPAAAPITFKEKRKDRGGGDVSPASAQPAAPAPAAPAQQPPPPAKS